jgi:hypothetical protein
MILIFSMAIFEIPHCKKPSTNLILKNTGTSPKTKSLNAKTASFATYASIAAPVSKTPMIGILHL